MDGMNMRRLTVIVLAALLILPAAIAGAETVRYSYDASGRLIRVNYGNGKGFAYLYDANGNLIARTPLPPPKRRGIRTAQAKSPAAATAPSKMTASP